VDIGSAALDRVDEHLVDELDDRRVFVRRRIVAGRLALVVARAELEVFEAFGVVEPLDDGRGRVECLLDRALDLLLVDQDRFDDVVRLELDLVERMEVRRIGNADEEAVAALEQRQRLVLRDEILADEAKRNLGEIERLDVEQRDAELGRRRQRDLMAADEAVLDEPGPDRDLLPGRVLGGFAGLALAEGPSATNRRAMPVRPASGAGFIWIAIGIGCNPLKSRM
jgi:hypothetical protein